MTFRNNIFLWNLLVVFETLLFDLNDCVMPPSRSNQLARLPAKRQYHQQLVQHGIVPGLIDDSPEGDTIIALRRVSEVRSDSPVVNSDFPQLHQRGAMLFENTAATLRPSLTASGATSTAAAAATRTFTARKAGPPTRRPTGGSVRHHSVKLMQTESRCCRVGRKWAGMLRKRHIRSRSRCNGITSRPQRVRPTTTAATTTSSSMFIGGDRKRVLFELQLQQCMQGDYSIRKEVRMCCEKQRSLRRQDTISRYD